MKIRGKKLKNASYLSMDVMYSHIFFMLVMQINIVIRGNTNECMVWWHYIELVHSCNNACLSGKQE